MKITDLSLEAAIAARCEQSLYHFVRRAWSNVEMVPFVDNWHIGAICEHLQAVTAGQITQLLINIPPGCSKSLLTCVFWPMWEWAINPSIRWFFASYDQRLSTRDSVRCRALIDSPWYQGLWGGKYMLILDQNQKTYYETDKKGYRMATSVGGHGTGEHMDRIVFDDPHNVQQAESELERQSVLDWWDFTMSSRGVSRNVRRVGIMQRLHHKDLSAHVLEQGEWTHICLPMRYELDRMPDTPLGWNDPRAEEGELLTPQQFTENMTSRMEKVMGIYTAAGQLQQRPAPRGGGMFKCLVAGTSVETLQGPKPIETVRPGDSVLTRTGFRAVVRSGQTGTATNLTSVLLSNGTVLTGTPEHLVLIQSKGFVRLDSLAGTDQVLPIQSIWNCLNTGLKGSLASTSASAVAAGQYAYAFTTGSAESRSTFRGTIPGSPRRKLFSSKGYATQDAVADTTSGEETEPNRFTGLYGKAATSAVFPLASISITKMETGTTMRLKILNVCPLPNIQDCTLPPVSLTRQGSRRIFGTVQRKAGKSTGNGHFGNGPSEREQSAAAPSVGDCSSPDVCIDPGNFVRNIVREYGAGSTGIPVYDLEVAEAHEFFANGILVHNSTWFNDRVRAAPYAAARVRSWDRAATAQGGCATAGVLMAYDGENFYVEDCVWGQWEPDERNQQILACALRDREKYGPKHTPVIWVESEGGSSGKDADKGLARTLVGHHVKFERVTGSKDVRAEPWATQLAAGNVKIVLGNWDINGFVEEHTLFKPDITVKRLGGALKDRVDAASSAFSFLANRKAAGSVRFLRYGKTATEKARHIVIGTAAQIAEEAIEDHAVLLITLLDSARGGTRREVQPTTGLNPPALDLGEGGTKAFVQPIASLNPPASSSGDGETSNGVQPRILVDSPSPIPLTGLAKLLGQFTLQFADVNPEDYQDAWDNPVEPYGLPVSKIMFNREQGKQLWRFLLEERDKPWGVLVVQDDTDGRRAASVAYALCDQIGLNRKSTVYRPADPDNIHGGDAPNAYVYQAVRAARGLVI